MKILVTGGAGFIGSHIVESMLKDSSFEKVRILDNFSTGFHKNIEPFIGNTKLEIIEGDIRDRETCKNVVREMDAVCHQAALGSVPRSIKDPQLTHDNNVTGFINILTAAKDQGILKFVYASSSSVYGDANYQPKVEERIGRPLSPYAVSKYTNELYADVFAKLYGMKIIGFRYFNVFGPRQDPNGPYAAVIPLFFKNALNHTPATINGDGTITRDYTYVGNVVKANINALKTEFEDHHALNIACGATTTLNELWLKITELVGSNIYPIHGPNRPGDILHSLANISKANELINYSDLIYLEEGLSLTYSSYVD